MKGTQLVLIATAAALLFAGTARAGSAGGTEATLTLGSATASVGETVSVDIVAAISGDPVGAWTVDPVWDDSIVHANSCTTGVPGSVCSTAFSANSGRVTGASATGLTGDVTLAAFEFRCLAEGTSDLTLEIEIFGSAIPEDYAEVDVGEGKVLCVERSPQIRISSGQGFVGETAKVAMSSDVPSPGLRSWSVDFTWDDQILELVECRPVLGVCNPAFGVRHGRVLGATGTALVSESVLAELTYRCKDLGTSAVTLEVQNAYALIDAEPIELDPSVEHGSIACRDPMALPLTGSGPHESSSHWPLFSLAVFGVFVTYAALTVRERRAPFPRREGGQGDG